MEKNKKNDEFIENDKKILVPDVVYDLPSVDQTDTYCYEQQDYYYPEETQSVVKSFSVYFNFDLLQFELSFLL